MRDLCADRPGLGTPACTVDPGHVIVETGLLDWSRSNDGASREDTILAGDALVRIGVDPQTELKIGWTAYGHVRARDAGSASIDSGTGDVLIGLRRGLAGPNGPVAIQPFVTLPTGGDAIGAGDWGAGVIVPFGFDVAKGLQVAFSPEIDAAVDEDRSGRHLAYGSVAGLSLDLIKGATVTAEIAAMRDDDPAGHQTHVLASQSLAVQPGENTQFDIGAVEGLDRDSPDIELYIGVVRRF